MSGYTTNLAWVAGGRRRSSSPTCRSAIRTITCGTFPPAATCCRSCWRTPAAATTSRARCSSSAGSFYRADGPAAMRVVGETEFVNGAAAMAASGRYGTIAACEGIVGRADLTLGAARRAGAGRRISPPATAASAASATPPAGMPAPTSATATPQPPPALYRLPTNSARASPSCAARADASRPGSTIRSSPR